MEQGAMEIHAFLDPKNVTRDILIAMDRNEKPDFAPGTGAPEFR
jgi:hypothetical protein